MSQTPKTPLPPLMQTLNHRPPPSPRRKAAKAAKDQNLLRLAPRQFRSTRPCVSYHFFLWCTHSFPTWPVFPASLKEYLWKAMALICQKVHLSALLYVRPTVHTNPSRKQSFFVNAPQTGGIWKRRLFIFMWTETFWTRSFSKTMTSR